MALLEVSDVEVGYGAVRALRGVSLRVEQGAMVALLGANGAGKSTMLKTISGVMSPTAGRITFDGRPIDGTPPNRVVALGIAHVPEGRKVFRDLTVRENLAMGAYARRDSRAVAEDLDLTYTLFPRLAERANQLSGSLSGGEQQMLAIGRGLMARPRLLLLDEPSLGLAPILITEIYKTLQRINQERGTALLIVEQNARVALGCASYGYVLQVGRVALEGATSELRGNRRLLDSYLGAARADSPHEGETHGRI